MMLTQALCLHGARNLAYGVEIVSDPCHYNVAPFCSEPERYLTLSAPRAPHSDGCQENLALLCKD